MDLNKALGVVGIEIIDCGCGSVEFGLQILIAKLITRATLGQVCERVSERVSE